MQKEMMMTRQAADYLGLKKGTLDLWRVQGKGPKYVKFGRAVRYRVSDLEQYIQDQTQGSTAEN